MKLSGKSVVKQAAIFLLVVPVMAGCQKQQQNNARPAHEQQAQDNFAGGGGREKIRVVCADEIQKYCANADRRRRCLRENMDKLSDACKAAIAKRGVGRGRKARDNDSGGDDN